ncbi:helicase-associated domain-containing protein [Streptomyces malaysiensis]|uniref:helicase-associated domain-containing protein n=1 Tax=Streptomyces malaysiensis TaxID=92644 RepID=UPI00321F66AB|nr:helicase-associated domain-containing protein [Streptomyces malaysiensis]
MPRTLAEELRTRPDDALAVLLSARPDLLSPVPNDLTQLATRAGTRASVVRAVERLDRFAQQTAEALAIAPDPCPYETLRDLLTGDASTEDARGTRASGGSGDVRGPDDARGPGGARGPDDAQDLGGARGAADVQGPQDARSRENTRGREGARGPQDAQGPGGAQDPKYGRGTAEAPGPEDARRPGEAQGPGGTPSTGNAQGPSDASAAGPPSAAGPTSDTGTHSATGPAPDTGTPSPTGTTPGTGPAPGARTTAAAGPASGIGPTPTPAAETAAGIGAASRIATPLSPDERAAIAAELPRAVATLREQALVWGGDDRLRLVRTARELLAPSPTSPSPTGLGPTMQEAASGMSPGRLQELLAGDGLAPTHDPVTAVAALAELFQDRARMAALLDGAPAGALAVLAKLTWGPPYGEASVASPTPPVGWPLDHGLLLPSGPRNVVLPREVALHLRHGRAHRAPEPLAPPLSPITEHNPQAVDNTAAGQTFTALATVEELLGQWESAGPPVLRAGGLSVRDLKRTAVALDVSEPVAAFWIELAYAAGLLASDGETDERYAPTPAYDDWLRLPAEERWARLAAAWLPATRTAGLVGGRDGRGRTLAALGPDLDRSPAPEVRRRILGLLATLPPGAAAAPEVLLARLRWERPTGHRGAAAAAASSTGSTGSTGPTGTAGTTPGITSPTGTTGSVPGATSPTSEDLRSRLARWTIAEAEMLGITGRAALSSHGRALLERRPDEPSTAGSDTASAHAARLLAPLLPEPLDHVLLQADLTAVAPGPLERPLAETLGVLADVESKGGATVYRFTPESVRRALDAGRTADDVHTFLAAHSRTPVPQPLSYLVDDVARKHGRLRIGAASAYLRCDDDTLLAEILADRRSAGLRLRRLAPTVLAAQAPPDTLLEGLRAMGYAPAAESAEGDVLISRPEAQRTPPRTPPVPVPEGPPLPDATLLGAAVRAIRAGDLAATAPHKTVAASGAGSGPEAGPHGSGTGSGADSGVGSGVGSGAGSRSGARSRGGSGGGSGAGGDRLPRTTSADTLATMQAAALTGSNVWIGYVNANGAATQRVIAPVRVEGGFVTAYDHTSDEVRTYPLHRITGAAELAEDAT